MSRIRTFIFGVYLSLTTLLVGGFGALALPFGLRRGARLVTRTWAQCALFGLKLICGVSHVIKGEQLPEGPAIVAANHQSMWETIAFFALAKKPAMIFKKELMNVPVYGWYGRLAGSIPIDRDAGPRAIKTLAALAAERLAEGCQIIVFPEGTRARLGEKLPLQPGVAAIYKSAAVSVTPALHDSGRCWRSPGGLFSRKEPGVITLTVLPAIEGSLDRKVFQARLEAALGPRDVMGLDSADVAMLAPAEGRPA
ncbi:MAG: lysophospholipid acyltransferase family protein [Parvularculaceae bacterium]